MATSTIYISKDCCVLSDDADTNHYSSGSVYLPSWTISGGVLCALLGFPITSAPASANVSSVTLHIKSYARAVLTEDLNRITTDNWSETGATWNNISHTTTNQLLGITWPVVGAWSSYNITAMYKDAKDAGMDLLGMRFTCHDSSDNSMYAREYESGDRAYITITYTTALPIKINISDSWKEVNAMKINIGDSWKEVVSVKQNIGDTWKMVF